LSFDWVAAPLLFGFAANTDNLTIGVAYGIKRRWIRWPRNLLIAVITTVVTLGAMAPGRQIRDMLPSGMPNMLGGILLLVFVAWNVYRDRTGLPTRSALWFGPAETLSVGIGESLILAGTLSINNIGLAVAGGIGGFGYISAGLSTFSFSVVMLALGQAVGSDFTEAKWVPQMLRNPTGGNAILALTGVLMLAGY
jgi:putative Mn2+ efflux pump MntP